MGASARGLRLAGTEGSGERVAADSERHRSHRLLGSCRRSHGSSGGGGGAGRRQRLRWGAQGATGGDGLPEVRRTLLRHERKTWEVITRISIDVLRAPYGLGGGGCQCPCERSEGMRVVTQTRLGTQPECTAALHLMQSSVVRPITRLGDGQGPMPWLPPWVPKFGCDRCTRPQSKTCDQWGEPTASA